MKKKGFILFVLVLLVLSSFVSAQDVDIGCCELYDEYRDLDSADFSGGYDSLSVEEYCTVINGIFHAGDCSQKDTKCCCDPDGSAVAKTPSGCNENGYIFHIDSIFNPDGDNKAIEELACQALCSGVSKCVDVSCGENSFSGNSNQCLCGSTTTADVTNPYCCELANQVFGTASECNTACSESENNQFVSGVVKADGSLLSGALVSIQGETDDTDENGGFSIDGLSFSGDKLLRVTANGCGDVSIDVDIPKTNIIIDLTCQNNICGNGVVESDNNEECEIKDENNDGFNDYCMDINIDYPVCGDPKTDDACRCIARTLADLVPENVDHNNCDDHIDNDDNKLVDFCEVGCASYWADYYNNDGRYMYGDDIKHLDKTDKESKEVSCSDHKDNDCDGYADFDDTDCVPEDQIGLFACSDRVDNDGDEAIDICDLDCKGGTAIPENVLTKIEDYHFLGFHAYDDNGDVLNQNLGELGYCEDGIDNDCDGRIDCQKDIEDYECACQDTEDGRCWDNLNNDYTTDNTDDGTDCLDSDCYGETCIGPDGESSDSCENYAIDTNNDGTKDTCCPNEQQYDCDGDTVYDTCADECGNRICGDCDVDNCEGIQCKVGQSSFVCHKNSCQEIPGTIISGVVKEVYGNGFKPIPGATVSVVKSGATITQSTDRDGRFSFLGLPVGEYTLRGTHISHISNTASATLTADEPKIYSIDIVLDPKPTYDVSGQVTTVGIDGKSIILKGYQISFAGRKSKTFSEASYSFNDIFAGNHYMAVSKEGYVTEYKWVEIIDGDITENFVLEETDCRTNQIPPKLTEVLITPGEGHLDLTWETSCPATKMTVLRCSNAGERAGLGDNSCTDYMALDTISDSDIKTYIDGKIETDIEYCYKVKAEFLNPDHGENVAKESNFICVDAFDDPCLSMTGGFCDSKLQVASCNNQNKKILGEVCSLEDRYYCYGPVLSEAGVNEASCKYQSKCDECSEPFGLFSSEVMGKAPLEDYSTRLCEDIPTCYYDYTETNVDKYFECSEVISCYDYNSEKACSDSSNLVALGEEGDYTNKCLARNCQWNPDPRYEEIGEGICSEIKEEEQDCARCDSEDKHNKIFGVCDRERCDLYGSCYWDMVDINGYETYSCTPKSEIVCESYDREIDCVGSDIDSQGISDVIVDVTWENPTAEDNDEIKISGTNKITTKSKDHLDLGLCTWGEPTANYPGKICYKDADYDRLINQDNNDCGLGVFNKDCQKDMETPVSGVDADSLICYGKYCEKENTIQMVVEDFSKTAFGTSIKWIGVTLAGSNDIYPNIELSEENLITTEFDDIIDLTKTKDYTLYFFSEDGAKNLEENAQYVNIKIDPLPPKYDFSIEKNIDEISEGGVNEIWISDVTISVDVTDEIATCSAELLIMSTARKTVEPLKRNKLENEVVTEWTKFYPAMDDGYYGYNVSCEDLAGNVNETIFYFRLDADSSVREPRPEGVLNNSIIDLGVITENKANCRYTTDLTIHLYSDIAENQLDRTTVNYGVPPSKLPDLLIVEKYNHSKKMDLQNSGFYEYKMICQYGERESSETAVFVIDLEAPITSPQSLGWKEYDLSEWKTEHEFRLECDDKKQPDKNSNLIGEPFGCRETRYCIYDPEEKDECELADYNDGDKITISESSIRRICYQSIDKGGNVEPVICQDIYVDNEPATFIVEVFNDGDLTKLLTKNIEYNVEVTSTEELSEMNLLYKITSGEGVGFYQEIILTHTGVDKYEATFMITEDNIGGQIDNAEWVVDARDIHNVESFEVTKGSPFTIDTAGPKVPEILYPFNWQAKPNSIFVHSKESIVLTGLSAEQNPGEIIRVYVSTYNFSDKETAAISIPPTNWYYNESLSADAPDVIMSAKVVDLANVGGNEIKLEGESAYYPLLKTEQYIRFNGNLGILPNLTYYEIVAIEKYGERQRKISFKPDLVANIPAEMELEVVDKPTPRGWFKVELPLLSGNNWIYAVAIDDLGNIGLRHDGAPFQIISDSIAPKINIVSPKQLVTASAKDIFIQAEIEDDFSGLNEDTIELVIQKTIGGITPVTIVERFSCDEMNCEHNNEGPLGSSLNIDMIYTPDEDFENAFYEITVKASDLAGGYNESKSWFEIDKDVPHEPLLDVEDAFVFNSIPYTNNSNPEINITFAFDRGKKVDIQTIELNSLSGNNIKIKHIEMNEYKDLDSKETTLEYVNLFSDGNDDKRLVFDIPGSQTTSIMIPSNILRIDSANLSLSGLPGKDSVPPFNINMKVNGDIVYTMKGNFGSTDNIGFASILNTALSNCHANDQGLCEIELSFNSDTSGQLLLENLDIKYTIKNADLLKLAASTYKVTLLDELTTDQYVFSISAIKETEDGWSKAATLSPEFYFDDTPPEIDIEFLNASMNVKVPFGIISDDPAKCELAVVKQGKESGDLEYNEINLLHDIEIYGLTEKLTLNHLNVQETASMSVAPPNLFIEHPDFIDSDYTAHIKCTNYFGQSAEFTHDFYLVHPKQDRLFYRNGGNVVMKFALGPGAIDSLSCDFSEIDSNFDAGQIAKYPSEINYGIYYLEYSISEENTVSDGSYKVYCDYLDATDEPIIIHLHNEEFLFGAGTEFDHGRSILCKSDPGFFFNEYGCEFNIDGQHTWLFSKSDSNVLDDCVKGDDRSHCSSIYYQNRNELGDIAQSVVLDDPCYNGLCIAKSSSITPNVYVLFNQYATNTGSMKVRYDAANSQASYTMQLDSGDLTWSTAGNKNFNCQDGLFQTNPNYGTLVCDSKPLRAVVLMNIASGNIGLGNPEVIITETKDGKSKQETLALQYFEIINSNTIMSRMIIDGEGVLNSEDYAPYCNDGLDNDLNSPYSLDSLGGDLADCRDPSCYGKKVDTEGHVCSSDNSEASVSGGCYDDFDNDMDDSQILRPADYWSIINNMEAKSGRFYDCYDNDCFGNPGISNNKCLTNEIVCTDRKNYDWDYGNDGESLQDNPSGKNIYDCFDVDCNGETGAIKGQDGCTFSSGCICELGDEGSNYPETCRDGFDNDFDGTGIDCMDNSGANSCFARGGTSTDFINYPCPAFENNTPGWCFDGVNNDYDNGIGTNVGAFITTNTYFDCADYDCAGAVNPSPGNEDYEGNELNDFIECSSNEGIDNYGNNAPAQCFDGNDNDLDNPSKQYNINFVTGIDNSASSVDCADTDCNGTINPSDNTQVCEYAKELSCNDGYDNDGDGLVDNDDTDCTSGMCYPSPINEAVTLDSCANGNNDDPSQDNLIDARDPDCDGKICGVHSVASNGQCESKVDEICDNGIDDDGDSKKDCLDIDCIGLGDCRNYQLTSPNLNAVGLWEYNPDSLLVTKKLNGGAYGDVIVNYPKAIQKGDMVKLKLLSEQKHRFTIRVGTGNNPLSNLLGSNSYSSSLLTLNNQNEVSASVGDNGIILAPLASLATQGIIMDNTLEFLASANVGITNVELNSFIGDTEDSKTLNIPILETTLPKYEKTIIKNNPTGILATVLANDADSGIYYCNFLMYKEDGTTIPIPSSQGIHNRACILDYTGNLDTGNYYLKVTVYDGAGNYIEKSNTNDLKFSISGPKIIDTVGGTYRSRKYFKNESGLSYEVIFESDAEFRKDAEDCSITIFNVEGENVDTLNYPAIFVGTNNNKVKCSKEIPLSRLSDSYYTFVVGVKDSKKKEIVTERYPFWVCNWQENPDEPGTFRCRDECSQKPLQVSIENPSNEDKFNNPLIVVNGTALNPEGGLIPKGEIEVYINNDFRAQLQLETKVESDFKFSALALSEGNNTIRVFARDKRSGNTGDDSVNIYYNSTGPTVNLLIQANGRPAEISNITIDFSVTDKDKDGLPDRWEIRKGLNPDSTSDAFSQFNQSHSWLDVYHETDMYDIDSTILKLTKQVGNEFVDIPYTKTIDNDRIVLKFPGEQELATGRYHLFAISVDKEGENGDSTYEIIDYDPDAPWPVFDFVPDRTGNHVYTFTGKILNNSRIVKAEFVVIPLDYDRTRRIVDITGRLNENNEFSIPHELWAGFNRYYIEASAVGPDDKLHTTQNGGVVILDVSFDGILGTRTKLIPKVEQEVMGDVFEQLQKQIRGVSDHIVKILSSTSTIDCGSDIDCMIKYSSACLRIVTGEHSYESVIDGIIISRKDIFEFKPGENNMCNYTSELVEISAKYSQSLKESLYSGINSNIDELEEKTDLNEKEKIGTIKNCKYSTEKLGLMFRNWKSNIHSSDDFLECEILLPEDFNDDIVVVDNNTIDNIVVDNNTIDNV